MRNTDPHPHSSDIIWLWALGGAAAAIVNLAVAPSARADRIDNQVAVFSGLDKVTARISKFEVELGKSAAFGPLKVTPHACYSRPTTEQPKTTTFVDVDEVQLDGTEKRIFTGWMFAESPGLYGVEHPTADVWLTECKGPTKVAVQRPPKAVQPDAAAGDAAPAADDASTPPTADTEAPVEPRRRVRR